jgi:hypothetical protein
LILISGAPSDELVTAAKENHVTEFLSKPFELAFIKAVLTRVLK